MRILKVKKQNKSKKQKLHTSFWILVDCNADDDFDGNNDCDGESADESNWRGDRNEGNWDCDWGDCEKGDWDIDRDKNWGIDCDGVCDTDNDGDRDGERDGNNDDHRTGDGVGCGLTDSDGEDFSAILNENNGGAAEIDTNNAYNNY